MRRRLVLASEILLLAIVCLPPAFAPAQGKRQKSVVHYKNVTLEFDASLAKECLAETAPAFPLENKTDKPDGVAPEHIVISFRGSYAGRLQRDASPAFALPRIYIFPASDLSDPKFDEEYPTTRQAVNDLNKLVARRAGSVTESLPFLPWVDESQLFISRKKLLRFRNGRGILFLTQYGQERGQVNNTELVYTFQGLTDDNSWYVSAVFPAAAQGLPATARIDNEKMFLARYDAYVRETTGKLNRLSARKFTPNLSLLEEIIRSLKVSPR